MLLETEELTAEQVRALIESIYCRKYIGNIKLEKLLNYKGAPYGYRLSLGMGCDLKPLEIAFDGTPTLFMQYLEKRLHQDHLADETYSYGMKGHRVEEVTFTPRDKLPSLADYTNIPEYFKGYEPKIELPPYADEEKEFIRNTELGDHTLLGNETVAANVKETKINIVEDTVIFYSLIDIESDTLYIK